MEVNSHMISAFGSSVQEHYVKTMRKISAQRREILDKLRTREDALSYVKTVREKVRSAFLFPEEKSPLKAKVIRSTAEDGYHAEAVLYESRPGYQVSANFYVPDTPGKHPAVLFLCGHSQDGKVCDTYQSGARELAKLGYAVLIPDPAGQGERYLFRNVKDNEKIDGRCCNEHNMLGKQMLLAGEWFGAWRAYDAVRGVDYMISRPEVDPSRIGVTGNSGGGTMTTLVNSVEDRFIMAAPSCYITSWLHNIENELPVDIEQIPPALAAKGCEMADLLIASAPRPLLILSQKHDFFDPRGSYETYEEVRKIYALLGAEDKIRFFKGPDPHGFTVPNRLAMCRFFQEQLGFPLPEKLPEVRIGGDELLCSASNCIYDGNASRHPWEIISEKAAEQTAARKANTLESLRAYFSRVLRIPEKTEIPYARILRHVRYDHDKVFLRYALEGKEGVFSLLKIAADGELYAFPEKPEARILVTHLDGIDEHDTLPPAEKRCADMILDIRGVGEFEPSGCDQWDRGFFMPYLFDYHYASLGLLTGDSYLGGKVRDILSAAAYTKANGIGEITLHPFGQSCIPALIAAVFDPDVKVVLHNAPESWESMVKSRVTLWPQACMIEGILKVTDLPEIRALLGDRVKAESFADAMFRK